LYLNGGSDDIDLGTLGQFTGLKTNDGIDIYEDDILQINIRKSGIGTVFFNEKTACFSVCFGSNEYYELYHFIHDNIECKIIGNVYENPTLLKG